MFKILVVEDDRELNRTVCAHLSRNGYEPVGCLSASEAYDAMYGNLFDCILSDIMMPASTASNLPRRCADSIRRFRYC